MEPIREAEVQTQPGKRLNEEPKKSGKGPLLIAGIVLAVLLTAYVGLCAYAGSLDTFYPNRHINGIDVGGLTVGQAQQRLEAQLLNQAITLVDNEGQPLAQLTVGDLCYTAEDFSGDAQFWKNDVQNKGFFKKGWAYLATVTGRWPGGAHWPDMDQAVFSKTVSRLTEQLSEAPLDASGAVEGQSVHITKARDGRTPQDLRLLLADISDYSQSGYQVPVSFQTVPAKTLTAQQLHDQLHGEVRNASYDSATDSIVPEQLAADFDIAAVQKAMDEAAPGETPDNLNYKPAMSNSFTGYKDGSYEKSFTEIIHFIDNRYRTIPDKRHRAIAGLSMGGFHTLYISLNYPDYFNYIGLFSAGLSANGVDPNSPMYTNLDEKLGNLKRSGYQLFWIGIGKTDFLYDANQQFRQRMDSLGMKYQYIESTLGHSCANWRAYLLQFSPMLFK
mgnify:CR=1 FL=1